MNHSAAVLEETGIRAKLEAHHAESFGWAMNCCRCNREDAENVLQLAYLKVLSGEAVFEGRSSFRTWLFGVIHKTAASERRSELFRRLRLLRWFSANPSVRAGVDSGPTAEDRASRDQDRKRLQDAVLRLPARQREILFLVFYHDLSIMQAAEVMGVAIGTARTHYERGKKEIRRCLETL